MAVASYALATLDEVKGFMTQPPKSSQAINNDLIEDLINGVTVMFHSYCAVDQFKSKDYTNKLYDGNGDKFLFLDNTPINSIASLADDTDYAWASDSTIGSDDYIIINDSYLMMKDDTFSKGINNVKITYNAGYDIIPKDLKQVCIEEVVRRFKHRDDFDTISKSQQDGAVTYTEKGFLTSTRDVLDKYINQRVL